MTRYTDLSDTARRKQVQRSRRRATVALTVLASLVLMFGTGYLSGLHRADTASPGYESATSSVAVHSHLGEATIGGATVPTLHCQEDEAITFSYTFASQVPECVHVETITQGELDRVQGLRDAGYDVEGYR